MKINHFTVRVSWDVARKYSLFPKIISSHVIFAVIVRFQGFRSRKSYRRCKSTLGLFLLPLLADRLRNPHVRQNPYHCRKLERDGTWSDRRKTGKTSQVKNAQVSMGPPKRTRFYLKSSHDIEYSFRTLRIPISNVERLRCFVLLQPTSRLNNFASVRFLSASVVTCEDLVEKKWLKTGTSPSNIATLASSTRNFPALGKDSTRKCVKWKRKCPSFVPSWWTEKAITSSGVQPGRLFSYLYFKVFFNLH